jgi:D-serine dehydratase
MANQLVGQGNMRIISELIRDPQFDFYCLVDSPELVDQMGTFFHAQGQRVHVLLELGVEGGRTGARNPQQVEDTLSALSRWETSLTLRGVEVYEGVLEDENAIRAFLRRGVDVARQIAGRLRSSPERPLMLSGAGSAWYDVVAEIFSPAAAEFPVEVILRPGCYVTSDAGVYRKAQERIRRSNPVASHMECSLEPALQLWAYVQSKPESHRAIVAMGKRDAAFDAGLPAPVLHFRPGWPHPRKAPEHWTLTKMMDQHSYMAINADDDLQVGDMIGCEISHPCLTFDKWRYLAVLDSSYNVVDLVETFF